MAVVTQPFDRGCRVDAPGTVDDSLGEFWEDDPWQIMLRHNQSAYERNRTFMNVEGQTFADISFISGADSDGDSRAVVAADFRNNGHMDLLVRQVGGGPLLLYENHFPDRNYLKVTLRGTQSNRLGIGARVTTIAGDLSQMRELFPENSFSSQSPSLVHFGLGSAETVDRLTVRWPSGETQQLKDIAANQHIVVTEGRDEIETVVPGNRIDP